MSGSVENQQDSFSLRRQRLVILMAQEGIRDSRVLEAMARVPRHAFVPAGMVDEAYENHCLPIGHGQTISQPYVVALMTELLALVGEEKVLEIGTGSGYQAAVLSLLAREVFSMERIENLQRTAASRLRSLGYDNVTVLLGDGSLGLRGHSPYEAIIATAATPRVPVALLDQLEEGGRLVLPVGDRNFQVLKRITRRGRVYDVEESSPVRFVPLIGQDAWS